jgi:hypothetical protein
MMVEDKHAILIISSHHNQKIFLFASTITTMFITTYIQVLGCLACYDSQQLVMLLEFISLKCFWEWVANSLPHTLSAVS